MPKQGPPCPRCKSPMQRIYIRGVIEKKRSYLPAGYLCQDPSCRQTSID